MDDLRVLSDSDRDLLVEMFCCVIAADKKVSGREVDIVISALKELGQTTQREAVKTRVVGYCKAIHIKGVDTYVADVVQRAKRLAGLPLATSFIEAQPTLLYADGESTPDEERVSQRIVECLAGVLVAAENEPMPDVLLDEPAATLGTSMLGTAKSSMALAGATAERTKITTVTLPAAFIALGRHCVASKAFSAEFPSIYAAIAKLAEETKATAEKLAASSTASTFAGKAQELASRGMTLAVSQKQKVQYQKLLHDLGKAVYEAKGSGSGPKDLCEPVSKCVQRLEQLSNSTSASAQDLRTAAANVGRSATHAAGKARRGGVLKSHWVKWIGGAVALLLVLNLFASKQNGGNNEYDIRLGMSPDEVVSILGKPDDEMRSPVPGHANGLIMQRWNRGDGPKGFDPFQSVVVMYATNGVPQNGVTMVSGNGKAILDGNVNYDRILDDAAKGPSR